MAAIMKNFCWALMLRGVLAIAFGVGMLFCKTLSSLGYLFGIFALSQGVLSGLALFTTGSKENFLAGIEAVIGVLAAFFLLLGSSTGALLWPSVSNVMFLIYIVCWIVVTGVVSLVMLTRLRSEGSGTLYLGFNAALCLIFVVLLISRHAQGTLGNAGVLGFFCIFYGLLLVIIGRKEHVGKS